MIVIHSGTCELYLQPETDRDQAMLASLEEGGLLLGMGRDPNDLEKYIHARVALSPGRSV